MFINIYEYLKIKVRECRHSVGNVRRISSLILRGLFTFTCTTYRTSQLFNPPLLLSHLATPNVCWACDLFVLVFPLLLIDPPFLAIYALSHAADPTTMELQLLSDFYFFPSFQRVGKTKCETEIPPHLNNWRGLSFLYYYLRYYADWKTGPYFPPRDPLACIPHPVWAACVFLFPGLSLSGIIPM